MEKTVNPSLPSAVSFSQVNFASIFGHRPILFLCLIMIPEDYTYNHTAHKCPIMALLLSDGHQTLVIAHLSVISFSIGLHIKPNITSPVFGEVKA